MLKLRVALPVLLALAACAPFPEIDSFGPDTGSAPALLPIDDLLSQAGPETPDPAPAIKSRAADLKARAAAIGTSGSAP